MIHNAILRSCGERNTGAIPLQALPPIGARVEGGDGDDYDTGTVRQHMAGAQVLVAWDSGVTTPAPASILTVI